MARGSGVDPVVTAVEAAPAHSNARWRQFLRSVIAGFRRRPWLVFVVAGLAFLGFALLSINLFTMVSANFRLIAEHGIGVLADGAARQLLELVFSGYGALAFYLVFKYCEHLIVHWLSSFE